jgi:hypothetical protein
LKKAAKLKNALIFIGSLFVIGILACLLNDSEAAESDPVICYGLRGGIVLFSLVGWFASQSLISARSVRPGFIGDGIHVLTAPLHRYFATHPRAANMVLVFSSAFIDILGIFLILEGILGKSMRPFAALILVFLMRQISQMLCALPVPPGMIWRHPGFPSLFVTYHVGNDFFFSGHTAIAVLGAIVAVQLLPGWLGAAAVCIAIGEATVVLVLRAHYTLDVITAVFAAFCAADLADWLAQLL